MLDDYTLYTEAVCASCESTASSPTGSSIIAEGFVDVMKVIENNLGGIDEGELGSRIAEWYDE
jgi:hypothetical protein